MDNGWIKIHRKLLESTIFGSEKGLKIWIWCLLRVGHKDNEVLIGRQKLLIKKGQFIMGGIKAEETLKIARATIYWWLEFFAREGMVDIKKTNKYTIITILNWDSYQGDLTSNEHQILHQIDTNKNTKKIKNKIPANEQGSFGDNLIPELIKLFEEVNPACKRMYGNKTQRQACQDLIDTYGFEEVSKVVAFLPQSNKIAYMPTITTPLQLWEKYQALKDKWQQKRSEITNKNQPNYVL